LAGFVVRPASTAEFIPGSETWPVLLASIRVHHIVSRIRSEDPLTADPNPLDLIEIDLPSTASLGAEIGLPRDAAWDAMGGDDLARFCQHCRKNVYSLSGMSWREAAAFDRETPGVTTVDLTFTIRRVAR
jgi:hypothetical protein